MKQQSKQIQEYTHLSLNYKYVLVIKVQDEKLVFLVHYF